MAQQRDEILGHDDYDGIQEYDNPLPRWWLWLFYGSVIFSAIYIPYYLFGFGPNSAEMYEQEMAAYRQQSGQQQEQTAAQAPRAGAPPQAEAGIGEVDASIVNDEQAVAAGKQIFTQNCSPCHGQQGQGGIGPNLTDNYWLHGNTYKDIVTVVTDGVPDKGMIAWKSTLNPEKIRQVAAFVYTLPETDPPDQKEPQGQEYPE